MKDKIKKPKWILIIVPLIIAAFLVTPVYSKVEPLVVYREIKVSGTLDLHEVDDWGSYMPWTMKVSITECYDIWGPGRVYVTIRKVGGPTLWSGYLSTGQSSPWVNPDGQMTDIWIENLDHWPWVKYKATFSMYVS